jgi:hypothetical protein
MQSLASSGGGKNKNAFEVYGKCFLPFLTSGVTIILHWGLVGFDLKIR